MVPDKIKNLNPRKGHNFGCLSEKMFCSHTPTLQSSWTKDDPLLRLNNPLNICEALDYHVDMFHTSVDWEHCNIFPDGLVSSQMEFIFVSRRTIGKLTWCTDVCKYSILPHFLVCKKNLFQAERVFWKKAKKNRIKKPYDIIFLWHHY